MEVGIANSKDPEIAANAAPVAAPFTLLTPPPVPYSLQAAHAKHLVGIDKALDKMGAHFDVSAVAAFYPMFRLSGYLLAHFSKDIKNKTPKKFEDFYNKLFPEKIKTIETVADSKTSVIITEPITEEKSIDNSIVESLKESVDESVIKEPVAESVIYAKEEKELKVEKAKPHTEEFNPQRAAPQFLRATETLAYGLVTYWAFRKENKQLVDDCALAISAENGTDEKDIHTGMMDLLSGPLRQSKNPIIVSAVDRQIWQNALRIPATAAMFFSIDIGVALNSLITTFERTAFSRPIAIDTLRKTIIDVQLNGLGEETKPTLVDNLIKILQQVRTDHKQEQIPKEQIDGLRPVLNLVADDVINKKFGFEGMLHIMGGGVLMPEHPDISLQNYEKMRNHDIADIAKSKHELLNSLPHEIPNSKIHAISSYAKIKPKALNDAAQTESLLKHRQILHNIPAHYGANTSMSYDNLGI